MTPYKKNDNGHEKRFLFDRLPTTSIRKRFVFLALIMIAACLISMLVMVLMLYHQDVRMQRKILQVSVKSQARLIEAIARNETKENIKEQTDVFHATLAQIVDAHEHYAGFGDTGEFTLARREGNNIIFVMRHRLDKIEHPEPVAFDSTLAEPMRRALEGRSGTMIGLDYRGKTVLAAYEPVASLGLGIVSKIDMSEIRTPFIHSVLTASLVILIVILTGTTVFSKISVPIVERLKHHAQDLEAEIKHRRQSEKDLQESKAFLERVMQLSPFAMWVADAEGTILKVNLSLCSLLHQRPDNIVGKYNVLEDQNLKECGVMPKIRAVFSRLEPCRFTITWEGSKAGRVDLGKDLTLVIEVALIPIINKEQKLTNVVCQWVDITEQKHAEKKLVEYQEHLEQLVQDRTAQLDARIQEAEQLNSAMVNLLKDLQESNANLTATSNELTVINKELDAFTYSVSHDLRAPLRHIDGFVKLLEKREHGHLDDTSQHYLNTIMEASQRMGRLIDDLLAFSRTGRTEIRRQAVDSNKIVKNVLEEQQDLTAHRNITWTILDLPPIHADPGLLRIVWDNLIGNAIKYTRTRETAHIEIGTRRPSHSSNTPEVTFFIRDNGVGFNPEYSHKLFGVFQRLHRDDEFEGTGIGLATVRRIIQRHGGQVWAEGEMDKGATFYFCIETTC